MATHFNSNHGLGTVNVMQQGSTQINQTQLVVMAKAGDAGLVKTHASLYISVRYQSIIDTVAGIIQLLETLNLNVHQQHLIRLPITEMTNLSETIFYAVAFLSLIDDARDISRLRPFEEIRRTLFDCNTPLRDIYKDIQAYKQRIRPACPTGLWKEIFLLIYARFRWETWVQDLQDLITPLQKTLDGFSCLLGIGFWDAIISGGQLKTNLGMFQGAAPLRPNHLPPAALTVMNHLGVRLPIPLEFCSTYKDLQTVIKRWCRDQPGDAFILSDSWELVSPESNKLIQQSEFTAVPDTEYEISIVLPAQEHDNDRYHCPRPDCGWYNGHRTEDNGWITCSNCSLTFSVSRLPFFDNHPAKHDIMRQIHGAKEPARHDTPSQQRAVDEETTPIPQRSTESCSQNSLEKDIEEPLEEVSATTHEELESPGNEAMHEENDEIVEGLNISLFKRVTLQMIEFQTTQRQDANRGYDDSQKRASENRDRLAEADRDTARQQDNSQAKISPREPVAALPNSTSSPEATLTAEIHPIPTLDQIPREGSQARMSTTSHSQSLTRRLISLTRGQVNMTSRDVVIAIMGPKGAGKSTFIAYALRQVGKKLIGNSRKSQTLQVRPYKTKLGDQKFILLDTPGLNGDGTNETEVLEMIEVWLQKTYNNQVKLSGIIHMHRISDNRMAGAPLKNLKMFAQLCGSVAAESVVLTTAMWGKLSSPGIGEKREKEMKEKVWKDMLEKNAKVARFEASYDSAWQVIGLVSAIAKAEKLLLQEEMVALKKRLSETGAGKTLFDTLQKQLDLEKKLLNELCVEAEKQDNPELVADRRTQYEQVRQQLEAIFEQVKILKIPFGRRLLQFFSFKRLRDVPLQIPIKLPF